MPRPLSEYQLLDHITMQVVDEGTVAYLATKYNLKSNTIRCAAVRFQRICRKYYVKTLPPKENFFIVSDPQDNDLIVAHGTVKEIAKTFGLRMATIYSLYSKGGKVKGKYNLEKVDIYSA